MLFLTTYGVQHCHYSWVLALGSDRLTATVLLIHLIIFDKCFESWRIELSSCALLDHFFIALMPLMANLLAKRRPLFWNQKHNNPTKKNLFLQSIGNQSGINHSLTKKTSIKAIDRIIWWPNDMLIGIEFALITSSNTLEPQNAIALSSDTLFWALIGSQCQCFTKLSLRNQFKSAFS